MSTNRTITLRNTSDAGGTRFLGVRISYGGGLDIEGYDSGPAVRSVFGSSDYEWHRTVSASDIPRLRAAMNIEPDADLLDHIAANFNGSGQPDLESFIRGLGIKLEFFSWISFDDLPGEATGG